MDFKITYPEAREYASKIKATAEQMNETFNKFTQIMGSLNSDAWKSRGSNEVLDWYHAELESRYPGFYEKVINYSTTIVADTYNYEDSDAAETSKVTSA